MATLTGTQIKNTYDSVLKVSDNTPLTTALKAVTDGIGNASPLLLSTTGVSANSVIQASGFQIPGGTSTQFLTADGSTSTTTPQVQSDWNATSGDAFILNKPTLFDGNYNSLTNQPTLFDGDYSSLTNQPTIPSGNQIIDWTVSQGATNIHRDNYIDWTVNQGTTTIHSGNFPASVAYNYFKLAEDGVVKGNVLSTEQVSFRSGTNATFTVINNSSTTATHEVKLDVASTQWDDAYTHSQATHAPSNAEANVQSDWNATSGDALILNKPTLTNGTVTGSGTNNYVPLWNGTTALDNSVIYQNVSNVGIGTTSPDSKLHIYANNADAPTVLTIENGDTGVVAGQDLSKIEFLTSDVSAPGAGVAASIRTVCQNAGNIFDLAFNTQHGSTRAERMRLDGLGNLGIGTTSPGGKLEIKGSTGVATSGGTLIVRQDGNTAADGIAITSSNAASHRIWKDANGKLNIGSSSLPSSLVQDLSGNIGINDSTPSYKLDVNGTGRFTGTLRSDKFLQITGAGTTLNQANGIGLQHTDDFANVGNDSTTRYLNHYGMGLHKPIGASVPGANGAYMSGFFGLDFFTSGTSRLHINQNGNVGIGTTSPTSKLQVNGLPSHASNAAAITAGLTTGAFYHTSGTLKVVI